MSNTTLETTRRRRLVSLRTLAREWDADRTTVRRVLLAAGVEPVVLGRGKNASIRYIAEDVAAFMRSRRRGA